MTSKRKVSQGTHDFFIKNVWWRVTFPIDMDCHKAEGACELHMFNGKKLPRGITYEQIKF